MHQKLGVTVVRTFADFDLWLGHAVQGRSKRHQLWLGRPGKGKTARLHRHVRNTVGHDPNPHLEGRVSAPIYAGRMTPSKWFIRGWQHRLEPLLCLNDLAIRRVDPDWESMLCQFLEAAGPRTIRWDLRGRAELEPEDRREIVRYLRRRGLLDRFTNGSWGEPLEGEERPSPPRRQEPRPEPSPYRESLPELDGYEEAYQQDTEEGEPDSSGHFGDFLEDYVRYLARRQQAISEFDGQVPLRLPRSYDTESTVVLIANSLGDEGWERIYSRLRVLVWDPLVDEQVEDLRRWDPPVQGAILGVIESCHRRGEILNLDYRAVLDAADALKLGMPWEDALRASFSNPADQQVQEDASAVLDWLLGRKAKQGRVFTERELYQEVGALRGDRNRARRSATLDYLVALGWVERFLPPAVLRPGRRGRRPGPSFRVLRLPKG